MTRPGYLTVLAGEAENRARAERAFATLGRTQRLLLHLPLVLLSAFLAGVVVGVGATLAVLP